MEQAIYLDSNSKNVKDNPIDYFYNENKLFRTQISYLTAEINSLREENFRLNGNLAAKEGELLINKSQSEVAQKMFHDTNTKLISSQNEITELRNELLKSIEEKNLAIKEKETILREKDILNLAIKDSQNEILNKSKEIQNYNQIIEELNKNKFELNNNLIAVRNEMANEKFSSERLREELDQLRMDYLNKEKSFAIEKQNYKITITNMNELIKDYRENIINITRKSEEDIHKIKLEKEFLQCGNDRLNLKIVENEMNLELKSNKIDELANMIIELKRHIMQNENEAKILREIITDKENEMANLYKIKTKYDSYISIEKSLDRIDYEFTVGDYAHVKNEYKKLLAINQKLEKDLSLIKESNEKYKIELNELQDMKYEYKKISNEYDNLYNQHKSLLDLKEKNEEILKEDKQELDVLNQFVEKLSKQNRELLYEIRLKEPGHNFLSKNLTREKYEEFIYYNINDLEPRLSELIKKNISLQSELDNLRSIMSQYESAMKEKEEVIKKCEEYVKNLEETNSNLKKEFETFKYYSDSHYHLFTLNFSADENSYLSKLEEIKDNLRQMDVKYQSVVRENQKNIESLDKSVKSQDELNAKIFELKNANYNKEIELNRIRMEVANYLEIRKNDVNLIEMKDNEIKFMKSELDGLKILSSQNLKEKEELVKNLSLTLNETNLKLNETNNYFKIQIEKLHDENIRLKKIFEEFTKSLTQGDNLHQKGNVTISVRDNLPNGDELEKNLESIKSKLLSKEEEILKLKESKSELEIKIENILSENSSLKYKNEFYTRRIKFFRNLLSTKSDDKTSSATLKFKRNPIFKERVLKVTEFSMKEPERRKEYSINLNEEVDSDYELLKEDEENINSLREENLENKLPDFDESITQKYVEAINTIQKLQSDNFIIGNKLKELNEINFNLVRNDLNAPYVYLFKKIEELSNSNVSLERENKIMQEDKLKIINDYAFINLESEQIKKNQANQISLNRELSEKILHLEKSLEEQMQKSILYSQSQLEINEKETMINSLNESKIELDKTINSLEIVLAEKNKMIENLEEQLRVADDIREKEIKNRDELHVKELTQSKSNIFKNFYLCFKRSKYLIETFVKLKDILEDRIEKLEKENRVNEGIKEYKELGNIITANEQQITELKRKIKEMEKNHTAIVSSLNSEIESLKAKEILLVNEIKTFKNINQFEGSLDLKNYFGKLLRNMHSSTNIINHQCDRIKEYESQVEKLKHSIKTLEDNSGVNKECDRCKISMIEVKALTENSKLLSKKLEEESSVKRENEKSLIKCKIEKDLLQNDIKNLTHLISEENELLSYKKESSNLPQSQVEKNKTFSLLINQLRRASKIISMLDKCSKELDEHGMRLLSEKK